MQLPLLIIYRKCFHASCEIKTQLNARHMAVLCRSGRTAHHVKQRLGSIQK